MPDLNWNRTAWEGYDWTLFGEEWSATWGGSEAQWFGALYPRIHRLLPARNLLELGPGGGRWARFLIPASAGYLGIDLSAAAVDACALRFADAPHARFVQNDGFALDAAPDGAFDCIFSFDSLVHAEIDVFHAYLPQLIRKLAPDGVAFLHHSNLGGFDLPDGVHDHVRARSVSARAVGDLVAASGGRLIIQEIIDWPDAGPIDCFTAFARADSPGGGGGPMRLLNLDFTREAALIAKYQQPWCGLRGS
ncbi:MAG: class I SAM-dependent methyltransferase [Pseudomonadota bacterium]